MRRLRVQQVAALRAAEVRAFDAQPRRRQRSLLRTAAEAALAEIDLALERIDDGAYGTCRTCREQIPDARLDALPESPYCAACAFAESRETALRRNGRTAGRPS